MQLAKAHDIKKQLVDILNHTDFPHVDHTKIVCFRSFGAKTRAIARIWNFPNIWQQALNLKPHYIIEVIAEKFDRQSLDEQRKTLIHELLHIPKNFSGALRPHRAHKWRLHSEVDRHIRTYHQQTNK